MAGMKRLQFSLRSMLVAVTLVATLIAAAIFWRQAKQEAVRLKEIEMLEWAVAHPDDWVSSTPKAEAIEVFNQRLIQLKAGRK
jgi:hypothetical protein